MERVCSEGAEAGKDMVDLYLRKILKYCVLVF